MNPLGIGTLPPLNKPKNAGTWLLMLPAGILGLILIVVTALGIKGWRGRRMYQAYVRERQMTSSRPS